MSKNIPPISDRVFINCTVEAVIRIAVIAALMGLCFTIAQPLLVPIVGGAIVAVTIGAPELIAVWQDPDFDPALKAFYYARVIEIPTPRWTAYDAAYFKESFDPAVPMTVTERAYASPIWYTPNP